MINYNAEVQEVTKESDPGLFWAILGGSPGNFGIITHYLVEVYRAADYQPKKEVIPIEGALQYKGPHGLKGIWIYDPEILRTYLSFVAEMSNDAEFPRNFDLCLSVLSADSKARDMFPELADPARWKEVQGKIRKHIPEEFLKLLDGKMPASIVIYAQWCPVNPDIDRYDERVDAWFARFRAFEEKLMYSWEGDADMATMTGKWIFPSPREFDLPYVKRIYATSHRDLGGRYVDTVVRRLDLICNPDQFLRGNPNDDDYKRFMDLKVAVQIQPFGGNHSKFFTNRGNGTSYSWRDTSLVQVLDCFHNPDGESKMYATEWATQNDRLMNGEDGVFSPGADKRLLWGSWGDWNMTDGTVWRRYYEDSQKYQRIGAQRQAADPNRTFTPNPFAVAPFGGR
ncbi:hypothetical protein AA313_de0210450 [Arthrobotrys entomopaga]|nr:hypothetical protein AA313_de0210450 [Arthrobotrys entomopaga]